VGKRSPDKIKNITMKDYYATFKKMLFFSGAAYRHLLM
jgi:hypothetical protein